VLLSKKGNEVWKRGTGTPRFVGGLRPRFLVVTRLNHYNRLFDGQASHSAKHSNNITTYFTSIYIFCAFMSMTPMSDTNSTTAQAQFGTSTKQHEYAIYLPARIDTKKCSRKMTLAASTDYCPARLMLALLGCGPCSATAGTRFHDARAIGHTDW